MGWLETFLDDLKEHLTHICLHIEGKWWIKLCDSPLPILLILWWWLLLLYLHCRVKLELILKATTIKCFLVVDRYC